MTSDEKSLMLSVLLDDLADISGWRGGYRERFKSKASPLVEAAILRVENSSVTGRSALAQSEEKK